MIQLSKVQPPHSDQPSLGLSSRLRGGGFVPGLVFAILLASAGELHARCDQALMLPEHKFTHCEKAAQAGDAEAQKSLGNLYMTGEGVQQNFKTAMHWFKKAAAQNHPVAAYNVGVLYDKGLGQKRNYDEAAQWYQKAAALGYSTAQYNLGIMYEYGQSMPENIDKALELYHLAAEQGEAAAQFAIGVLYDKGEGVERDTVKAYMWWDIAGEGHPHAIHNRDSLTEEMDAGKVQAAKALAAQWRAQRPGLVQIPAPDLQ